MSDLEAYRGNPFWETTEFHRKQKEKIEMVERNGTDLQAGGPDRSTRHLFKSYPCRKCGGWYFLMPTENGKRVPVDPDSFEDGDLFFDRDQHIPHSETCDPEKKKP